MDEMHKLLKRQLKKHLSLSEIPSDMESFIYSINDAYYQNDIDKMMVERSLEISSKELVDTIDQLKETQSELLLRKEEIKNIAFHDSMTGLANRYMLSNETDSILMEAKESGYNCAVLFIDLDNFKKINDVCGHRVGDEVLSLAAKRLSGCIRKNDKIYRYGGDEFLIILTNIDQQETVRIIKKILKVFESPFQISHHEVYTTPSIGVSYYSIDGNTMEELIRNADIAMYWAKEFGKNSYEVFSSKIAELQNKRFKLENALRNALRNNEFILYYQPQIDVNTGRLWGVEALLRWQHPEFGMIMPGEFIQIAEETGDIVAIGEWVTKTVCNKSKCWFEQGIFNVPVAINVSAVQLKHSDFVGMVEKHLRASGVEAKKLVVEFTESIMQDTEKSFEIICQLNKLGVKVAIDDFGTGYSSLSLIKDLDIDQLKIDSYFVKDIEHNPNTVEIIKLIVGIGKKLNFSIVMEGVENEQQAAAVIKSGCSIVQGYFFSMPLSEEQLLSLLKSYANKQAAGTESYAHFMADSHLSSY